jgi:hypothetical protein
MVARQGGLDRNRFRTIQGVVLELVIGHEASYILLCCCCYI